ncbi:hypothetical protein H2201_000372 [Coniosporium apollinis]|uniref:Ubiquitin-like protease family profile domain-containing protein n=1 Tax=Coniosporium apollinis TaxID=61459 RepID=A0ABQ9P7B1_9PEZI|nr:hypothetical protein H2201_000372 [Coniosporium apollinis]
MPTQQPSPATRVAPRAEAQRLGKRKRAPAQQQQAPAAERTAFQHAFTTTLGLFNRVWTSFVRVLPQRLRGTDLAQEEIHAQRVAGGHKRRAVGRLHDPSSPSAARNQDDPGYHSRPSSASPAAEVVVPEAPSAAPASFFRSLLKRPAPASASDHPAVQRAAKRVKSSPSHPLAHLYAGAFAPKKLMKIRRSGAVPHSPDRLRVRRAARLDELLHWADQKIEDADPNFSHKRAHLQEIRNLPHFPGSVWDAPQDEEHLHRPWNEMRATHASENAPREQPNIQSLPNYLEISHLYNELFPTVDIPEITVTTHGGGDDVTTSEAVARDDTKEIAATDEGQQEAVEAVNEELSMLADAPPPKQKKSLRWTASPFVPDVMPVNQWKYYTPGDPPNEMRKNIEDLSPNKAYPRSRAPTDVSEFDTTLMDTPVKFSDAKDKSPLQRGTAPATPGTQVEVEKTVQKLEDFHVSKPRRLVELPARGRAQELEVSASAKKKQEQRRLEEEKLRRAEEAAAAEKARKKAEKAKEIAEKARKQAEKKAELLRKEKEAEEEKLRKEAEEAAAALAAASVRLISPLNEEWEDKVSAVLRQAQHEEVARSLTAGDMARLKPGVWLNDNIINAYLTHMVDAAHEKVGYTKSSKKPPTYHAFNTHFFSNISEKGPDSVHRWLTRAHLDGTKLLSVKKIFVPVNCSNSHWTLMVISPQDRTIEYLDSLGAGGGNRFNVVKNWLRYELKGDYVEADWTLIEHQSPQQNNHSDCGAFVCFNSYARLRNLEPMNVFEAKDMPSGRKQIAATLLNKGFTGVFAWT